MKKKNVIIIECAILLFFCLFNGISYGVGVFNSRDVSKFGNNIVLGASTGESDVEKETLEIPTLKPYPAVGKQKNIIYAKEYALYHKESGKVLFKSQNMESVPMASTTKVMTNYLVVKYCTLDEEITISEQAASQDPVGSLMGIVKGETFTVESLMHGSLLVSGNDASAALAEYVGGKLLKTQDADSDTKIKRFVEEMNSTAVNLKLADTYYVDPVGLNDEGYTTAIDLAKLASVVFENKDISRIMTTANSTVRDINYGHVFNLKNSNRFVTDYFYEGTVGGKTGYTIAAGHCLVVGAQRGGNTLISVILFTNSDTVEASAQEARKLIDDGFSSLQIQ